MFKRSVSLVTPRQVASILKPIASKYIKIFEDIVNDDDEEIFNDFKKVHGQVKFVKHPFELLNDEGEFYENFISDCFKYYDNKPTIPDEIRPYLSNISFNIEIDKHNISHDRKTNVKEYISNILSKNYEYPTFNKYKPFEFLYNTTNFAQSITPLPGFHEYCSRSAVYGYGYQCRIDNKSLEYPNYTTSKIMKHYLCANETYKNESTKELSKLGILKACQYSFALDIRYPETFLFDENSKLGSLIVGGISDSNLYEIISELDEKYYPFIYQILSNKHFHKSLNLVKGAMSYNGINKEDLIFEIIKKNTFYN